MSALTSWLGQWVPSFAVPAAAQQIHALDVGNFYNLDDPRLVAFLAGGRETSSGVVVNERMAMRNPSINRAVRLVGSSIGMLPLQLFRRDVETFEDDDGETQQRDVSTKARDHYLFPILHRRPNLFMTAFDFKTYMMGRAIFRGIAYALKIYTIDAKVKGGRRVKWLIPLNPDRVEFKINKQWEPEFHWQGPDGRVRIPWQDMFWFRGPYSEDGITGAKLIDVAAETIGLAHQAEAAAGRVFKQGSLLGGVLEHPKALKADAVERLRAQFEQRHAGTENAGKWIVAEDGLKVNAAAGGSTLKDAQSADTRKFQAEEVSRFLDIPRPLMMFDETSWGSGIEQLGLFFVIYCLMPWFVQWEEAIGRSLLSEYDQDTYYAKFIEAALLRGSLKEQAEFFSKALGSGGGHGWMAQNEVRDKFDLKPKRGADSLPQPKPQQPGAEAEPEDEGGTGGGPQPPARAPKRSGGSGDE